MSSEKLVAAVRFRLFLVQWWLVIYLMTTDVFHHERLAEEFVSERVCLLLSGFQWVEITSRWGSLALFLSSLLQFGPT